jgi:hypothetical protein
MSAMGNTAAAPDAPKASPALQSRWAAAFARAGIGDANREARSLAASASAVPVKIEQRWAAAFRRAGIA